MAGPYTLTWDHGITAEQVIAFSIEHSEGAFAVLNVTVVNPRVALLSGELWATLSDAVGPLFYGRLVGVPVDLQDNSISLEFDARPDTFDADKAALAETLKVAPFWDPVWIAPTERTKPDTVLESRPQRWHVDRVTHAVTVSDILQGEAGTVELDPELVVYESVKIEPGETPAELITCNAEVRWRQRAHGQINISSLVLDAFREIGSTNGSYILTYTGGGLMEDWPKIGHSIGGGWSVGDTSVGRNDALTVVLAVACSTGGLKSAVTVPPGGGIIYVQEYPTINVVYGGGLEDWGDGSFDVSGFFPDSGGGGGGTSTFEGTVLSVSETYTASGSSFKQPNYFGDGPNDTGGPSVAGFPQWSVSGSLRVRFEADRERVETIAFSIAADVQPLVSAREDANIAIGFSSSEIDQPIDPGGAMPIGDTRRNSYMLTDRGKVSLAYLIALCRARLLARARAVQVAMTTTFDQGRALSLRHSVSLSDPRLPGGVAIGKVVNLVLSFDAQSGVAQAEIVAGCCIGRGNTLTTTAPTGVLTVPGVVSGGIQAVTGGATEIASDISYEPFDTTPITDGDFDLYHLTADSAVESVTAFGGAPEQEALLLSKTWTDSNEAIAALNAIPTRVEVVMKPVTGDPIVTPFAITVSDLMVPKTIDLESA